MTPTLLPAAQGANDAHAIVTLIIAVLGLALSVASLVWQAATFRLEGPRVRVELQAGAMAGRGYGRVPLKADWRTSVRQMQAQGMSKPIAVLVVRNVGRAATTVVGYSVKGKNGVAFGLTGAPPGTPALPHRLEAGSMVLYYLDLIDYYLDLIDVASVAYASRQVRDGAKRVFGVVDLGSGKVIHSKESFGEAELLGVRPALQNGTI